MIRAAETLLMREVVLGEISTLAGRNELERDVLEPESLLDPADRAKGPLEPELDRVRLGEGVATSSVKAFGVIVT